jgi:hypothetical protein
MIEPHRHDAIQRGATALVDTKQTHPGVIITIDGVHGPLWVQSANPYRMQIPLMSLIHTPRGSLQIAPSYLWHFFAASMTAWDIKFGSIVSSGATNYSLLPARGHVALPRRSSRIHVIGFGSDQPFTLDQMICEVVDEMRGADSHSHLYQGLAGRGKIQKQHFFLARRILRLRGLPF